MGFEFKNSFAAIRRRAFCEDFDLDWADDFYGFRVNGVGFLYRLGSIVPVKWASKTYFRIQWRRPLGTRLADMHLFSFVLFHKPAKKKSDEIFYVKSVSELDALIRKNPILKEKINIADAPSNVHRRTSWRDQFIQRPISPKELKRVLNALTKKKS